MHHKRDYLSSWVLHSILPTAFANLASMQIAAYNHENIVQAIYKSSLCTEKRNCGKPPNRQGLLHSKVHNRKSNSKCSQAWVWPVNFLPLMAADTAECDQGWAQVAIRGTHVNLYATDPLWNASSTNASCCNSFFWARMSAQSWWRGSSHPLFCSVFNPYMLAAANLSFL